MFLSAFPRSDGWREILVKIVQRRNGLPVRSHFRLNFGKTSAARPAIDGCVEENQGVCPRIHRGIFAWFIQTAEFVTPRREIHPQNLQLSDSLGINNLADQYAS